MADIKLEHITKRFGEVVAVNDLSLEVHDREFVVFLGPSGCGKTTTLRSIAGLEHPEEGDILIDERRVNALSPADRDIAFVFQFYALYPHLTVYENIAFPLKAVKMAKSEIEQRVKEAATILQIESMLARKPGQLSGGEMQRVALGRAIVRRPKAFLMDEPMGNLDAKLRVEMRSELKRLQHELGATTIFVTHDQGEAMSMADRIAVMHQGVLQQIGTPQEVYNRPQSLFVAGFMGSPSMNLIHGELQSRDGRFALHLTHTDLWLPLSEKLSSCVHQRAVTNELVLGIRPEHITVTKESVANRIKASVHLIESIGAANIIDIFLGEDSEAGEPILLRARTHPAFQIGMGDPIWLDFDEENMHLFDRETDQQLIDF